MFQLCRWPPSKAMASILKAMASNLLRPTGDGLQPKRIHENSYLGATAYLISPNGVERKSDTCFCAGFSDQGFTTSQTIPYRLIDPRVKISGRPRPDHFKIPEMLEVLRQRLCTQVGQVNLQGFEQLQPSPTTSCSGRSV